MKKIIFGFAIAVAATVMVSCGNKQASNAEAADAEATEQVANDQQKDDNATEQATPAKVEDRAWYTVEIPAIWESKQYVSEMIVKKEGAELNFKEQAKAEVAKWIENISSAAEAKLDDITAGGITWTVFKNAQNFKTIYVAQVGEGVVRIGSSLEDANNADVIKILESVKAK